MRKPRICAWLFLLAVGPLGFAACANEVSDSDPPSDDEAIDEIEEELGSEDPYPGPGGLPPGGHDPGGPGYGWGHGWADDPQYAPYTSPRDPDPYREQRHAKQREEQRIHEENQRHGGGGGDHPAPRDQWVNCKGMNNVDCMMKCAMIGVSCVPIQRHPRKANVPPGELFACKNGTPTSVCSYRYTNGDVCVEFKPFGMLPWCIYEGGKP